MGFDLNLTNTEIHYLPKQLLNATYTKLYTINEIPFQPTHKKGFRIKPVTGFRIIHVIYSINIELS